MHWTLFGCWFLMGRVLSLNHLLVTSFFLLAPPAPDTIMMMNAIIVKNSKHRQLLLHNENSFPGSATLIVLRRPRAHNGKKDVQTHTGRATALTECITIWELKRLILSVLRTNGRPDSAYSFIPLSSPLLINMLTTLFFCFFFVCFWQLTSVVKLESIIRKKSKNTKMIQKGSMTTSRRIEVLMPQSLIRVRRWRRSNLEDELHWFLNENGGEWSWRFRKMWKELHCHMAHLHSDHNSKCRLWFMSWQIGKFFWISGLLIFNT